MDSHGYFFQAAVYLLAAVIAVPIAKRLGLGSVLGYLLAGVIIGPFVFGFIAPGGNDVMHFAEFGVVMMLFLIGLELKPALLWQLRGPILGLGGAQVVGTTLAAGCVGIAFGLQWPAALAVGMIGAMSSTAIVLQSLTEKGWMKTPGGQSCFSVLLFQDIAVIPILAMLPLLAFAPLSAADAAATGSAIAGLPGWQQVLARLAAIAAIIFAGRFLLRHFFRFIAGARLREVFTATALLLIVGIALLMQLVGLSAALGAFLAGVVLAESEYRHQLEADIEPFKGLLLGLFFISVGASIDFILIGRQPATIAAIVATIVVVKFLVLLGLGTLFKLKAADNFLFAFALAQGGEFAFVLLSFARQQNVLRENVVAPIVAAVAVSMALTPLLFVVYDKLVRPRFGRRQNEREADEIEQTDNPVLMAGFGRFGHIPGRLLLANGIGITVLDHDAEWVETLRKLGLKGFYGDASRESLLRTAGAERAKLFICAVDDPEKALRIIDLVREHFPHLKILARAYDREHAYELVRRGLAHVYRETLGSGLDLGVDALEALGVRSDVARRQARIFKEYDEAALREMALLEGEDEEYFSAARKHVENIERILRADAAVLADSAEDARKTGATQRFD